MFPGYQQTFRVHGGRMVKRSPDMPNQNLGIAEGEVLNPITNKQAMPSIARLPKLQGIITDDDLAKMKLGQPFKREDFPQQFFLGNALY